MYLLSAKERAVVAARLAGRQHANERARMRAECDCCLCTRHARTLPIHTRRGQTYSPAHSAQAKRGRTKALQLQQCGGPTDSVPRLAHKTVSAQKRHESKQAGCLCCKRLRYTKKPTGHRQATLLYSTTPVVTDALSRVCPHTGGTMQGRGCTHVKAVPAAAATQLARPTNNAPPSRKCAGGSPRPVPITTMTRRVGNAGRCPTVAGRTKPGRSDLTLCVGITTCPQTRGRNISTLDKHCAATRCLALTAAPSRINQCSSKSCRLFPGALAGPSQS